METYEEERERQIRENAEFLASLGIEKLAPVKRAAPRKRVKDSDEEDYAPKRDFGIRARAKSVSYRDDDYYQAIIPKRRKTHKPKRGGSGLRRSNPGRRIVGNRIYDSAKGATCHQCRQKTLDKKIACSNDDCTLMMDHKCLLNRYSENSEELDHSTWTCPKCRNICNCSFCRKKLGLLPTGQLSTFIKLNGIDAAKKAINAEKISDTVLFPSPPMRGKLSRRYTLMDELDFEGRELVDTDESDGEAASDGGSRPARRPTRTSKRLANSDVLERLTASIRITEDDLEWNGWSDCPRRIN
ncbi:hypothetical protein IWW55_004066, partial [Coemansia sp. RSA 2706]